MPPYSSIVAVGPRTRTAPPSRDPYESRQGHRRRILRAGDGVQYSESWIYGGASDRDAADLSEDDLGVVGNYVAGIGLPRLLEQAAGVATRVREMT